MDRSNVMLDASLKSSIIIERKLFGKQERLLKRTPNTLGKAEKDEYDGIRIGLPEL